MKIVLIFLGWCIAIIAVYLAGRRFALRRRSLDRAFEPTGVAASIPELRHGEYRGWLVRWLSLAGFRQPTAPAIFVGSVVLLTVVGGLVYLGASRSSLATAALRILDDAPGGIGDIFRPLVYLIPWLCFGGLAALPWMIVRAARRKRVSEVEQQLPLALDLLATLSEAGMGFDAALARILDSQPPDRVLARELRTFQAESLAGWPRVQSLRRLGRRIDVSAFTSFISALVQAEQTGAGVAEVLRRQADDLRDYRRQRAVELAMRLPVKLLFPLIICFLPGISVVTLGPTFHQFFRFADSIMHVRSPR